MDEKGLSRAELARLVDSTGETMAQLFGPEKKRKLHREGRDLGSAESRLVPKINAVLGLPAPELSNYERDAIRAELDAVWPALDEEDRRELLTLARRLSRVKR